MKRLLIAYVFLFCVQIGGFGQDLQSEWLTLINQGKEKYAVGNFRQSYDLFYQASQLIPTDTTAFVYMLDCAYKTQRAKDVYTISDNLKLLEYSQPKVYEILIATAREFEGDDQKALNYVAEAKEKYPYNQAILFEEIRVYYKKNDLITAKAKLQDYLTLFPASSKAYRLLHYIRVEKDKNYPEAMNILMQAQTNLPDSIYYKEQEANLYLMMHDTVMAENKYRTLIEINPGDPNTYYNLALVYFNRGETERAIALCRKALEINPSYLNALYNLGVFYLNTGLQYNAALSDMTVDQYILQGQEFERNTRTYFEEAKPFFEQAIVLNPDELEAYACLNTINVLLENLKINIAETQNVTLAEDQSSIDSAGNQVQIAPDPPPAGENTFHPQLVINDLFFDYNGNPSLKKGSTGFIRFKVENIGQMEARDLEIIVMQPVVIPDLFYESKWKIGAIPAGKDSSFSIPVTYSTNNVNTLGIRKVENAANKLRLFVKEPNGYNADLVEFPLLLGNAGDELSDVSETEDLVDFSPEPISRNILMIIGIDNYEQWDTLKNAVKDAHDVKNIFISKYRFDNDLVYELYDRDAKHENIRNELIKIKKEITPDDNLVIYYAGHGFYDAEMDEGSWIPVNARKGEVTDYIPNTTIIKYIASIDSRHTFLIADACYSGSIFGSTNKFEFEPNNDKKRSRWGLSSGGMETVSDGSGRNSPFASALIQCLTLNTREYLPVSELISFVKFNVKNNTQIFQTPSGRNFSIKGNEGGEFLIYHK
jgi:tetratricopeptide (TPR) repeat protein